VDALFLETHPEPEKAKSDGPNMVPLNRMKFLLEQAVELHAMVREIIGMPSLDWAEVRE
jgi:2-dehydro-3-deoxyphosphooctonate aldolase (KDO 8-P synthase)